MKRLLILLFPLMASAQDLPRWGVKTNLLWDATATVNLGAELRTGGHTSIDLPLNYNAWSLSRGRKWKHVAVQPELRWWPTETFDGHFFGLHLHGAHYNVIHKNRYEGWLGGAGASYGYRWNFSRRWALEATLGVGYAHLAHNIFDCDDCGEKIGNERKNYFGPTRAGLSLIVGLGRAPQKPPRPQMPAPVYVAPPPAPKVVREPRLVVTFIIPEVEEVKSRSASGAAYLDFAVGRSEILENFRGNAAELRRIHRTIEDVTNDPDATITAITIVGHASPEAPAEYNRALSERRARALSDRLRAIYGLHPDAWGAGEDWATLDSLLSASAMPEKYRALEIVRGGGDPDARERRLKTLPVYRQILAELYPRLRRSDYTIKYTVVPFTVERGKEVLRTRPMNLSLNEMMLIARTYPMGSAAHDEVFEIAARVFPASDVANINAAAIALERNDAISAAHYLARVTVRTDAYWNNAGVLAWLRGDKAQAAVCFAKGGANGQRNAVETTVR